MKIKFQSRLSAIKWIAQHSENEGQFEVLREQLTWNYIYTKEYFLQTGRATGEVVLLKSR